MQKMVNNLTYSNMENTQANSIAKTEDFGNGWGMITLHNGDQHVVIGRVKLSKEQMNEKEWHELVENVRNTSKAQMIKLTALIMAQIDANENDESK